MTKEKTQRGIGIKGLIPTNTLRVREVRADEIIWLLLGKTLTKNVQLEKHAESENNN